MQPKAQDEEKSRASSPNSTATVPSHGRPVQAEGGKLTGRCLIVDTGSIFSSLPHWSATGPKLEDPACAAISCWGDIPAQPKFAGQLFEWRFLQVVVTPYFRSELPEEPDAANACQVPYSREQPPIRRQ
jgi:hypothetical protein